MDLTAQKKSKINLEDFDFKKDVQQRLFMADFTCLEIQILEEILFSPLKISIEELAQMLDLESSTIFPFLEKLENVGFLCIQAGDLLIDKEMRKHYEFQIEKFDEDFKPDMEFLQKILKRVPIQILPTWYALPRSSNNIFESIIEKYLCTPLIYYRHLVELKSQDPIYAGIINDVFQSPEKKVAACVLKEKYDLSAEEFEEYMILLELSFTCCLSYAKVNQKFEEVVTPFYEWKNYLCFLEHSNPKTYLEEKIQSNSSVPFSFIENATHLLEMLKVTPLLKKEVIQKFLDLSLSSEYIEAMIKKLCLIRFIEQKEDILYFCDSSEEWLIMSKEHKALHIYRHPSNQLLSFQGDSQLCTEKNIKASEKCICRVLHGNWVKFKEVVDSAITSFASANPVELLCKGKHWAYDIPNFTKEEIDLMESAVFEGLYEAGIVIIGKGEDNEKYFRVTKFGRSLFEV